MVAIEHVHGLKHHPAAGRGRPSRLRRKAGGLWPGRKPRLASICTWKMAGTTMERAGAHRPQGGRKTFFGHHISEIKFVLNFKQRLRTRAFVFFTLVLKSSESASH